MPEKDTAKPLCIILFFPPLAMTTKQRYFHLHQTCSYTYKQKIKYNFYQRLIPHLIINKNIVPKTTPTNHIKRNTLLYLELLEQGTSQYSCGNSKMYSFNSCFNSMTILHINPNSTMHTVP